MNFGQTSGSGDADLKRLIIEALPSNAPSPAEELEAREAVPGEDADAVADAVRRVVALVLAFPQECAHSICRALAGLEPCHGARDLAGALGVHRATAYRHIAKAKALLAELRGMARAEGRGREGATPPGPGSVASK